MNNAQQRGGKHANTETCRRNGRTAKWEDRARQRPETFNHQCCHLRRSPDWVLTFTSKTSRMPDYQHGGFTQTQLENTRRTSGSRRRHTGMGVKCQVQPSMLSLAEEPGLGSNLYLQNIRKIFKTCGGPPDCKEDTRRTIESRRGHAENHWIAKRTHGGAQLVE